MTCLLLSVLLAATASAAPGAPVAPSAVLASAAKVDNTSVTVTGTVGAYFVVHSMRGTFTKFQLCDDAGTPCIGVVTKGDAHLAKGAKTTQTGTFHVHFSLYGKKGDNVLGVGL